MKTNLFRKFRWYIVGLILVVIMLSVGLSFCTWDDLSINTALSMGRTGEYETIYKLVDDIYLDDSLTKGENGVVNIGDIVTFGRYLNNVNDVVNKAPLRWVVVDGEGENLTLLTESVVAFGSFWGTQYYEGGWRYGANHSYYQNYEKSTVRAWLNSSMESRNDDGPAMNGGGAFAGFMKEAFNIDEQKYILPKTIHGMYGSKKQINSDDVNDVNCESYEPMTDKVWIPSYSEVYGSATNEWWNGKNDGFPNTQFRYFIDDSKRKSKTTAFASSCASNYTWLGLKDAETTNWQNTFAGDNAWWWLRSPHPTYWHNALAVGNMGVLAACPTFVSYGGVRPAICIPV